MVRPENASVYRSSLVTGLAVAFAIMGAVLATVGATTGNWFALVPAALFGATAYFMWYHASGRLADRVYRSFERAASRQGTARQQAPRQGTTRQQASRQGAGRQRAPGQGATRNRHTASGEEGDPRRSRRTATDGRGGFGAGPRGDWERPGGQSRERVRQERARYERARRQRAREHARRIGGGRRGRGQQASGMTIGRAAKILGVSADADEDAVRTAYRERIKEVHPDTEGGDEEQFKRVRDAYEVLSES